MRWVLLPQQCSVLRQWRLAGYGSLTLSVNAVCEAEDLGCEGCACRTEAPYCDNDGSCVDFVCEVGVDVDSASDAPTFAILLFLLQ